MKNLTQETSNAIGRVRALKSWKLIAALVIVAGVATLTSALPGKVALADHNSFDSKPEATFTKWVTSVGTAPVLYNMAGLVSGEVGGGQFVGEVLELTPGLHTTKIKALYHINGGAHQFTARMSVVQNEDTGTAELRGVITSGWRKGAQVLGSYQVIAPCGIINAQSGPFGDVCFQGNLNIMPGS